MPASANYYTVLYTKFSRKKHKSYDDGVLVLDGKYAVLKNMEGKQLSRSLTKFKTLELEGSLGVGGYDLEVVAVLPAIEYTSGRVFIGGADTGGGASGPTGVKAGMKTVRPSTSGLKPLRKNKPLTTPATALHNPDAAHAFVLQRPPEGGPGVPVVVDPHLARMLRPHQRVGIQFMWDCVMGRRTFGGSGCILADAMGLGKTLSAITLAFTMCRQGPTGRPAAEKVVIVTPAALVGNWRKEFTKWVGSTRIKTAAVTVGGKEAETLVSAFGESSNSVCPVLIVSYEMFRKYAKRLSKLPIGLLICDEGHRLKNSGGNQTIRALSSCPTMRRVILSGTPVQNDLTEFFSMVNFVNPNVLGSLKAFRTVFQAPIERGRDKSASPAEQELGVARSVELARLTQQFVLRRTSSVLMKYLPPKVECVVFCHLSPLQRKLYQQLLKTTMCTSLLSRTKGGADGTMVLVLIGLLKKVCAHPDHVYDGSTLSAADDTEAPPDVTGSVAPELAGMRDFFPETYTPHLLSTTSPELPPTTVDQALSWSTKLALLDSLLTRVHAMGDRIVLVSNYTQALNMLQGLLRARGRTFLRLDGSVENAKRQPLVDKFNNLDFNVFAFLLSSKAGGVGLNLIGANRLVLFDPDWNPAVDQQAMARVWRDGQKREVYVYRLITTGTIEEKMYQRQILKEDVAGAVVDDGASSKRNLARDDLKELFRLGPGDEASCETFRLMTAKQSQTQRALPSRARRRVVRDADADADAAADSDAESKPKPQAGAGAGDDDDEAGDGSAAGAHTVWTEYTGPLSLGDVALREALADLPPEHRVTFVHTTCTKKPST